MPAGLIENENGVRSWRDIFGDFLQKEVHCEGVALGRNEGRALPPDPDEPGVGYGRPPLATRFRPGVSGNPRGRPKGARNFTSIVAATLGERIVINENGRRRRITKLEAAVKQLVNRAAGAEARSIQILIALLRGRPRLILNSRRKPTPPFCANCGAA